MGEEAVNFNIWNSIILAGLLQGFVFVYIVLSQKKYRVKSTYYLTALLFTFSYSNLIYYLEDANIITYSMMHLYFMFPFPLLNPALFYFYFKYFLNPEHKLSVREKWLFAPAIIALAAELTFRIPRILGMALPNYYPLYDTLLLFVEFSGVFLTSVVFLYCYFIISKHERDIKYKKTIDTIPGIGWFKKMAIGLMALCVLWLGQLIYVVVNEVFMPFYALWIGMSIMIYWLGHVGIYKYGVQQERKSIRNYSIENKVVYPVLRSKNGHIDALENLLVNQKMFLDPMLTLDKLAEEMKLSKSHLSRIINSELGIGFPDYLNSLRVEEAKRHLLNPEFANYTLVAIGLEAGFNSKTTFNTVFKKITTMTPSEFRNGK